MGEDGALAGAVVRIQTTTTHCETDSLGYFDLQVPTPADSVVLTAWAPGYYIGGGFPQAMGDTTIVIHLHAFSQTDNPDYEWVGGSANFGDPNNCENCHAAVGRGEPTPLPYDEWLIDAHGQSARNPRFLTMYLGTDLLGNKSPDTRYGYNRDYGKFPLPPVYDETWFGPGYKLDFPQSAGNCAACHTPLPAPENAYGVDPSQLIEEQTEGISCDFCHKVWEVNLDPETGLPHENRPGVLSIELNRPPEGHQFFAGPLDDVAPGEDTYTPIQKESRFCAPCHSASFWGVPIYNSFGEWLESPYSDPETGQTCQDCHMPPSGARHFARLDQGGLIRDPQTLASHRMPGALDIPLLQNAVSLSANGRTEDNQVVVEVRITNDLTGHHVPTDSPLRHLILLVIATHEGDTLDLAEGTVLPDWCGVGDPAEGYYSGLPGKAYAKILEEVWTGISPSAAYWNQTRVVSDNRLAAFETDVSSYRFAAPESGETTIEVQLWFRRAFRRMADWKGWTDPDILMENSNLQITH